MILILLLALVIRIGFYVATQPWDQTVLENTILIKDGGRYHDVALGILNEGTFNSTIRTPGYSTFIALVYFFAGIKVWLVLLVQVLLDVTVVLLIYFIAKEMFESETISKIAAFFYSINFLSAYYASRLLSDTLFTFFFTLFIYIFILTLKRNKIWRYAFAGLALGIATLIKPVVQYYFIITTIAILFQKNKPLQKIYRIFALLIIFAITLSFWQFRNLHVHGHYALSNYQGWILCRYYAPIAKANIENISLEEARAELEGDFLEGITDPYEKSFVQHEIAMEYIKKNAFKYGLLHLKGCSIMLIGTAKGNIMKTFGLSTENKEKRPLEEHFSDRIFRVIADAKSEYFLTPILGMQQLLEYLFLLIGLIVMWLKDKKLYAALVVLTILYYANLAGLLADARYKLPIIPLYLTVSGKGFYEIIMYFKKRKTLATP
jgi:hypothetical protein